MTAKLIDIEVDGYHVYQRTLNGPLHYASVHFAPPPGKARPVDKQDAQGRWIVGPAHGLSYAGCASRVAFILARALAAQQ